MKKTRVFSFILSAVMTVSAVISPVQVTAETDSSDSAILTDGFSVNATNSFGAMLASELSAAQTEQLQGNGNTVFSVEMDGNLANVSFRAVQSCTLIVGIYDEAGESLLASGRTEVSPEIREAQIEIACGEMPQFFYLRAYLVDSLSLAPLSIAYSCPNYTEKMQEFFAKTVDDFDAGLVLNLDDDPANNFAVFKEDTLILTPEDGCDTVVSADAENAVYVIENADDTVLSLQAGDVLSYEYNENDLLIVKVEAIETDGTTATIHGTEAAMEDVFAYVRIDAEQSLADADFTPAENAEIVSESETAAQSKAISRAKEISLETSDSVSYTFKEKELLDAEHAKSKISGSLKVTFKAGIKFYLSADYSYFEWSISFTGKINVKITGEIELGVPLCGGSFNPVKGIEISIEPKFVAKFSVSAELKGDFEGTVGFRYDPDQTTNLADFDPSLEFKIEGSIFLGFDFSPKIKITVVDAEAEGEVGAEATAKKALKPESFSTDVDCLHECRCCFAGELCLKATAGLKFKTKLKLIKLSIEKTPLDLSVKIKDFYFSVDRMEFKWEKCPHQLYRVNLDVTALDGNPAAYATVDFSSGSAYTYSSVITGAKPVTASVKTDDHGSITVFMPLGRHTVTVTKKDGGQKTRTITLSTVKEDKLTIDGSMTKTVQIQLLPFRSRLTVSVTDTEGEPLPFARVLCGNRAAFSAANGKAVLNLTAGTYQVKAELSGYYCEPAAISMDGTDQEMTLIMHTGQPVTTTAPAETSETTTTTTTAAVIVDSGECGAEGDNVTWTLDSNGVLTVSGKGSMADYSYSDAPFMKTDNIKKVVIQNGVTNVGAYSFCSCKALNSVLISDSVTSIGNAAFNQCSSLTSVNIPDSVTSIGDSAFSQCSSLASVHIPEGVTYIGTGAFTTCTALKEIEIPDSVTTIGVSAFSSCSSLISVTIPDRVTSIEFGTFSDCSSLVSVHIPESVTSIGDHAFDGCQKLTDVSIPDGVTRIGSWSFGFCKNLLSITLPDSLTYIGDRAFYYCTNLNSVNIPDNVTSIGDFAFYGCSWLPPITIPENTAHIGENVFYGCNYLPSINVAPGNQYYASRDGILYDKDFSELIVCPGGRVDPVEQIPDSVRIIKDYAFSYCNNLQAVTIPEGVTSIGFCGFIHCEALTSIVIPYSVTSIGHSAFASCTGLKTVSIPANVTSIDEYAFCGCKGLTSIIVAAGNPNYTSQDGVLFNKEMTECIQYPAACTAQTYVLPDGVTHIGNQAFCYSDNLTSLTIPDSVTSIGYEVFAYCGALRNVYYNGTEEQWNTIEIDEQNSKLAAVTVHFAGTDTESTEQSALRSVRMTPTGALSLTQTAELTELLPARVYNFYILHGDTEEDMLNPANLLYMTQFVSDAAGAAALTYTLPFEDANAVTLAVPFEKTINAAKITIPDVMFTGETVSPTVTVTSGGEALTEGVDYELSGELTADGPGVHLLTITGIGDYCGEFRISYRVICAHEYADGICQICGAIDDDALLSSDVNTDTRLTLADAVFLMRIIGEDHMPPVSAESIERADMNSDGMLTVLDLRKMLQVLAGIA